MTGCIVHREEFAGPSRRGPPPFTSRATPADSPGAAIVSRGPASIDCAEMTREQVDMALTFHREAGSNRVFDFVGGVVGIEVAKPPAEFKAAEPIAASPT